MRKTSELAARTPGYSGKPLAAKLGIKPDAPWLTDGAPTEYASWLGELPSGAKLTHKQSKAAIGGAHLFVSERARLAEKLRIYRTILAQDGMLWISWPKKAAKVPTDITEDVIRAEALPLGFVDVKVCAVSEVWSGLKLVIRRTERT